ncbi:hypothetical protein Ccrd_013469, partial [Cynara cardunculus var. scolymus]
SQHKSRFTIHKSNHSRTHARTLARSSNRLEALVCTAPFKMSSQNKPNSGNGNSDNKKRKQHYRPHNKAVKKGSYPLRPGVQGFFITCDGGRERQASQEAVQVIDSFYEELVEGKDPDVKQTVLSNKPTNKKIKFTYSDSEEDEDQDNETAEEGQVAVVSDQQNEANQETSLSPQKGEVCSENQTNEKGEDGKNDDENVENENFEDERQPGKKQRIETDQSKCEEVIKSKLEEKSVDKLIEAELEELKDKSKRHFNYLDTGCNGVIFVQMRRRDEDPTPKEIAQRMITSAAATRKHMSRLIAIITLLSKYFFFQFAVLCEARANSGLEKMKFINVVAKSVPEPHKVDLTNPERTIVVQIAKTVCCIGVVDKYKELAKYNLRQLTSSKQ